MAGVCTTDEWTVVLADATREVFNIMLGCEIESLGEDNVATGNDGSPGVQSEPVLQVLFPKDGEHGSGNAEVTAVVGIAGEICGVLNFACSIVATKKIAARMLGIAEEDTGEQQYDAIGEICNMIAGSFKMKLPGLGDRCMLSVPTIVVGSNYRLRALSGKRRLEYRCSFEGSTLRVTLEIQQ